MRLSLVLLLALGFGVAAPRRDETPFRRALAAAESALAEGELADAREHSKRALERDRAAPEAWSLLARVAQQAQDRDLRALALHRELDLRAAAGAPAGDLAGLRRALEDVDPFARERAALRARFTDGLRELAADCEEDGRPHGAIFALRHLLALAPEDAAARADVERLASAPDPSLAEFAAPRDLLAGVSSEWIAEHDAAHASWERRAVLERENYATHTDAGYEVLMRSAEAMERMNAFYREFFSYGAAEDGRSIPRIELRIFRDRDEYLALGSGPPAAWSAGQFTGGAVETYAGEDGLDGMSRTLFHEAAHQFVSLATNASGWLNEGLASFFEGSRLLANGAVVFGEPADHRLVPLADRMERGWMRGPEDGRDDASDPGGEPAGAPRFRTVVEGEYEWGPSWYAPTWGVVYFLYQLQDPVDGRFVYRAALREYMRSSGGKQGESAVEAFEATVLAHPRAPFTGVDRAGAPPLATPASIDELDEVWKPWILALREELIGRATIDRPCSRWARLALANGEPDWAREHYERGLRAAPEDAELRLAFAELLASSGEVDRAARLVREALRLLESAGEVDEEAVAAAEKRLRKLDPKARTLVKLRAELATAAAGLVARYETAGFRLMALDLSRGLAADLELPELLAAYEGLLRRGAEPLELWALAYDEESLAGWNDADGVAFRAAGAFLEARNGAFDPASFDYRVLALDRVTSGDYSFEAVVEVPRGAVGFAGLIFGRKAPDSFHGLVLHPGHEAREGLLDLGWLDLMSAHGGTPRGLRHVPAPPLPAGDSTRAGDPRTLRIDVVGREVDAWLDGQLVATHAFPSAEVLRGGFGLIVGPGAARFRDVRFLDRAPGDPAAKVARDLRLEALLAAGAGAVEGSFQGRVPPALVVDRWIRGEPPALAGGAHAPRLLAFLSAHQNELVPVDAWLRDLAERHADVGLSVVCLLPHEDSAGAEAWLAGHPLPGAVAVDARTLADEWGSTFDAYEVARFGMPRLLLLDVDGTVAWEGDPGFPARAPYDPARRSYLDDPLDELVATRKLREISTWSGRWSSDGRLALGAGDLAAALPLLEEAESFPAPRHPEAEAAARRLAILRAALADLSAEAAALEREDAQPAIEPLLVWADLLGIDMSDRARRAVERLVLDGPGRAWPRAENLLAGFAALSDRGEGDARALISDLRALGGALPADLADALETALAEGGTSAVHDLAAEGGTWPARWLARNRFGW